MTKQRRQASSRDRLDDILSALRYRIAAGLVIMLFIMAAFTVVVTILFLVGGQAPFHANGTTYGATVLTYLGAGVTGGVVLGLALPLARWRWGSALAGGLAAIPVYGSVMVALEGPPWRWDPVDAIVVGLVGMVVGASVGYFMDRMFTTPR